MPKIVSRCNFLFFLGVCWFASTAKSQEVLSNQTPVSSASVLTAEQCLEKWENWKKSYAASTPLLAENKNSAYKFTAEQYQSLENYFLKGSVGRFFSANPEVKLPEPLFHNGKDVSSLGIKAIKDYVERAQDSIRNRAIEGRLRDLAQFSRSHPEELILVDAGQSHVLDFFLRNPEENILYSSPRIRKNSGVFSQGYVDFIELAPRYLEVPEGVRTLAEMKYEDIAAIQYLSVAANLVNYYNESQKAALKLLFEERDVNAKTVFLGDSHTVRETEVIDQLPPGECYPLLGIKRIRFVTEQVHIDEKVDLNTTFWEAKDAINGVREGLKKIINHPQVRFQDKIKAQSLLQKNDIYTLPIQKAYVHFLRKASSHVEVEVQGLEVDETAVQHHH